MADFHVLIGWLAWTANVGVALVIAWQLMKHASTWPTWRRVVSGLGGAMTFAWAAFLSERYPAVGTIFAGALWAAVSIVAGWLLSYVIRVEHRHHLERVRMRKSSHLDIHAMHWPAYPLSCAGGQGGGSRLGGATAMGDAIKRFKHWRTGVAATVALPEILRELANFMDADPSTPVHWQALLLALGVLFGFTSAADATEVKKVAGKAEAATNAAVEAQATSVAAVQVAAEATVVAESAAVKADTAGVVAQNAAAVAVEAAKS